MTRKIHPLDELAQELYDTLQGDIEMLQAAFAGPVPVGTRRVTPSEVARTVMQMTPVETAEVAASAPADSPVFTTALERLGAHGLVLLPYLQPGILGPEGAAAPTSRGPEGVF